jgi:hypothetical protein
VGGRYGIRFGDAPSPQVTGANGAHFAGPNQAFKRPHAFFQRSLSIITMSIIEIEPVRPEPPQALFALALDLPRANTAQACADVLQRC